MKTGHNYFTFIADSSNSTHFGDSFSQNVCLEGSIILSVDFLIYFVCYTWVICKARRNPEWMKVGFVSLLLLSFPLFYALMSAFGRFWVFFASQTRTEQCYLYHPKSIFGYTVLFI